MARIVVVHDVEDVDRWLSYTSERADAITAMGATDVVDHVAADGGRTVAISAEADDVDAVVAATSSPAPELMGTMQRHGVIPPVRIFVQR